MGRKKWLVGGWSRWAGTVWSSSDFHRLPLCSNEPPSLIFSAESNFHFLPFFFVVFLCVSWHLLFFVQLRDALFLLRRRCYLPSQRQSVSRILPSLDTVSLDTILSSISRKWKQFDLISIQIWGYLLHAWLVCLKFTNCSFDFFFGAGMSNGHR